MDSNELEELDDDAAVEITDLHQDDEEGSANVPRFFTGNWLFSRRYRKQRNIVAAICSGLMLLIILFTVTPVNRFFFHGSTVTSKPTSTFFGLDANPPWGSLSVDGKRVAVISRGAYTIFSLQNGQHTLTWQAAPFAPQQCRILVPLEFDRDTCQFSDAAPELGNTIRAYIRFSANVDTLAAVQRTALLQETQAVLDRQQSSETIQVGEMYAQTPEVAGSNRRSCRVIRGVAVCFTTAHEPLKAVLNLQMDAGSSPAAPCTNGGCDSSSQNCRLFCDVPAFVGSNFTQSPAIWQASVQVQLLWQFTTSEGRVVEKNQADSFLLGQQNASPIILNITWNGRGWGVTFNGQSGSFGNDDPVCQASTGDVYSLLFGSTPLNSELRVISGFTYATGCLIKISLLPSLNSTPTPTPSASQVAFVMQRFGVLLAVNALAHRLWPFLPVANASTQILAQRLITKGG